MCVRVFVCVYGCECACLSVRVANLVRVCACREHARGARACISAKSSIIAGEEIEGVKSRACSRCLRMELHRAKRPRVVDLGRESQITASALHKVLAQVRDEGIPDAISSSTRFRQRREIARQSTELGSLILQIEVTAKSGNTVVVPVQSPIAMLSLAVRACPDMANILRSLTSTPQKPLRIAVYSDEITPNDPLKTTTRRMEAIYWSILEFGPERLANESYWFTLCTIRSELVHTLGDKLSELMKVILQPFFNTAGHSFRSGVTLDLGDAPKLIFADIAMVVGDEGAIKAMTGCKGASGTKLCLLCTNVVSHRSPMLPCPTGVLVASTCVDKARITAQTDAGARAFILRCNEVRDTMPKARCDETQQYLGWNAQKAGMILDDVLNVKIVSSLCWDWLHVYFVGGIFVVEVTELLKRLHSHGLGATVLDSYLQLWTWPKAYASAVKVCSSGHLKGTGSELLGIVPVLQKWLEDVVQPVGICRSEVISALALMRVVEQLQLVQRQVGRPKVRSKIDSATSKHIM